MEPPVLPAAALERETVNRTRAMIRRRTWTLALALFLAMLPFSIAFQDGRVTFLMLRDLPVTRWLWVAAAVLALDHYWVGKRLKLER